METFPVLDLSDPDESNLATRWDEICRETGFLSVVGHGIPPHVVEPAFDSARIFFRLPLEEKRRVAMPFPGYPYGYSGTSEEDLRRSMIGDSKEPPSGADPKESLSIGPEASWSADPEKRSERLRNTPTQWPSMPEGLGSAFRSYYLAASALGARLMKVAALALDLHQDYFKSRFDNPMSAFRALHYPDLPDLKDADRTRHRAGAHTDFGALTMLRAEAQSYGLQIRLPDGTWLDVPARENAFIVNIGDLLARWTNDRWVSTLHRVVCPAHRVRGAQMSPRYSLAFFYNPNWDAEIRTLETCLDDSGRSRYEPVLAGEHLMGKYRRSVTSDQ